ncbi:MAG TPA: Bax inhibitor-1/YccA family protein [Aggregatilineaceae bacterium]|nr:Bax inhibitor-1/YccA family protein [Aggregatilineaceae bacterium]
MDLYRPQPKLKTFDTQIDMRAVMQQVYLWMTAGLGVSFGIAFFLTATNLTVTLMPLLMVGMIAQLIIVFWLSARVFQMSAQRATNLFLIYAALNGLSLSLAFYIADLADVTLALFATSAMFGAMSIVGYTTKVDLSKMGGILLTALIGLIIASIVNIFWASSGLYWLITYAGVLIFVALTAYDTQMIKRAAYQMESSGVGTADVVVRRVAIFGALRLYLDFINLFWYILRIVSDRR